MQGKPTQAEWAERADEKADKLWFDLTQADLIPTRNRTGTIARLAIALDEFASAENHALHLRLASYEAALREIVRYRDEVCVGTEGLVMSNIARKALDAP